MDETERRIIREYHRQRRKNPKIREKERIRGKEYYEKNKKRINLRRREHYKKNSKRIYLRNYEWVKKHPEKMALIWARYWVKKLDKRMRKKLFEELR